jgi:hypothetical protein
MERSTETIPSMLVSFCRQFAVAAILVGIVKDAAKWRGTVNRCHTRIASPETSSKTRWLAGLFRSGVSIGTVSLADSL